MRELGKVILLGILVMSISLSPVLVLAHEGHGGAAGEEPAAGRQVQRLKKLRQENPEEFRRVVKEKKAKLRERLFNLRETDPQPSSSARNAAS